MAYRPDDDDAFGSTKTPSLSWKGLAVGTMFTCEILGAAKVLHSRDFETGEPAYWDPLTKQNPKLSAVVNVRVITGPHSVKEERSIWAARPSALYAAIADAQKAAGAKLAAGGTLHVKFSGEIPHENKRYSPIKQYQARYIAPPTDGFADAPPAAPSHYAQPAQATQSPRPASWGAPGPATQPGWQPAAPQQPSLPGPAPKGVGGVPF